MIKMFIFRHHERHLISQGITLEANDGVIAPIQSTAHQIKTKAMVETAVAARTA